jgi:hypothetical protein
MYPRLFFLTLLLSLACDYAASAGQQSGRPASKASSSASTDSQPSKSIPKVGCDECLSSLLLVADADCIVRVDGEGPWKISKDGARRVRVGIGEHLVSATLGDVKWEHRVTVEKPGQVIVKTDFGQAQTQATLAKVIAKWVGEWIAGTDYGQVSSRNGSFMYYSHFLERYTFRISQQGGCTVIRDNNHDNDYTRNGESEDSVVQRVTASARTAHATEQMLSCTFTPEGGIEVGGTPISVSADGNLTFKKVWGDEGLITVPLNRKK